MKLAFIDRTNTETGAYAVRELKTLLGNASGVTFSEVRGDLTFSVATDTRLPEYAWRVHTVGKTVHLLGKTVRESLMAAYEALKLCGFLFGTETVYPERVDFSALEHADVTVKPFVRLRGVRQHINFPMDISAYPLEAAEEYIRSLPRMQMNAITFHSYDEMWHRGAGRLFYGQGHPLSAAGKYRPLIHNRSMFFPPEGEAFLRDEKKLNDFAVERLRRLIAVARKAGLHVTVSMELSHDADTPEMIAAVKELLDNYPDMDCLEWISPEGGAGGPGMTVDNAADVIRSMFGDVALDQNGRVTGLGKSIPDQLPGALESIRRTVECLAHRDEIFDGRREIPIRAGLYITDGDALRVTKAVMDRVLPAEMPKVYLPGHGARYQCGLIRKMKFDAKDWQNTVIHSWAEFDGNMYLLQNCTEGLETLLNMIRDASASDQVYAFYVNHWRTAENAVCLAYAGDAMVHRTSGTDFYRTFAMALGIPAEPFAGVMGRLGALDTYNRDHIFNIGFCYLNCWIGPRGLSWLDGMETRGMRHAVRVYTAAADEFDRMLAETKTRAGIGMLRLLSNRCRASVCHIRGVEELKAITAELGTSVPCCPGAEQLESAYRHSDRAEQFFDQYASLTAERMPDRGCEGTLISYLCTMPVYVSHVRDCVLAGKTPCTHKAPKAAIIAPV